MYYAIIEKSTGIMQGGASNFTDHTDRPLHESLAYAPLNELLVDLLVGEAESLDGDSHPVDYTKTYYNSSTDSWVIILQEDIPQTDPLEKALADRQERIDEANVKLSIPDISASARSVIENYIAELTSINITAETVRDTRLPKAPF